MKIGAFSIALNNYPLEEVLKLYKELGLQTIELGCGGYSKSNHISLDEVLSNSGYRDNILNMLKQYNIQISGLGTQGNPVHPDPDIAARYHADYEKTVLAAEKMGVDTILLLSGCPGGSPADRSPNWVVCPWPLDFPKILDYQWSDVLIPYWKKAAAFAAEHGIKKLAIEPHPGFCVYNPATLLRLRKEAGPAIGANLDPSHLFWQGMDPLVAIEDLSECIYHFHVKDSMIEPYRVIHTGVLDPQPYSNYSERSWNFRTLGYGHSTKIWKDIVSKLAMIGYDGTLSIEHEDNLMAGIEGFKKGAKTLRNLVIREKVSTEWWKLRPEG